jgi:rhodanese-related sulfurtransferase
LNISAYVTILILSKKGSVVEFIQENLLLLGLAIGSAVMLLMHSMKKNANGVPNLKTSDAITLINRSHAVVLDVRNANEFAEGHIAEAKNISLDDLPNRLKELNKYKNKAILVNCQKGARGAKACAILKAAEFTEVHHLEGGLDAWLSASLPVVKS